MPDEKKDKILEKKRREAMERGFVNKYEMEIHSFTTSIEPYYFWILDFMRKFGFKIEKHKEEMASSVVSQFFGEMSSRRQFMEKRGMEIMATVNAIVRSVLQIVYDLKELDRRLEIYKDIGSEDKKKKEAARYALKRVWMDEVDVRKGGASINSMSAQRGLEFTLLRDAFMMANNFEEVDKMDLNDRVKRVLKGRLEEYLKWETESNKELTLRKNLEVSYLKSQVESLRLYSTWARPYLKAAELINFKEPSLRDPELIQAFDQRVIEIMIRGVKKGFVRDFRKPKGLPRAFKPLKMKHSSMPTVIEPKVYTEEEMDSMKRFRSGSAYALAVIEVRFTYRTRPIMVSQSQTGGGGSYRDLGKLNIEFIGYAMTQDEYDALEKQEESESLKFIEGLTTESLGSLREELEKYLDEFDEAKKEEKKKERVPLLDKFFKSSSASGKSSVFTPRSKMLERHAKKLIVKDVADRLYLIYDTFKSANGFKAYPYPPEFKAPPRSILDAPSPRARGFRSK